jgi:uncharacterized protein DUF6247
MSQPVHAPVSAPDPEQILSRLPEAERARFLSEYRTALDAAHEVWRYRQLQELLTRWDLIAAATSKPGYAQARDEARTGAGEYASLDEVIARRQRAS